MSQVKDFNDPKPSGQQGSRLSLKSLDRSTYHYYRFLYQSQNHMLVRTTKFFGRKSYKWFRLTDNELLLYSKRNSSQPKTTIPLSVISFIQATPILKGFTHCIMLLLPNNPAYWFHFKNENEQFFFTSLLPSPSKETSIPQVFVQNHTFNPEGFDKINQPEQDQDNFTPIIKEDEEGDKQFSYYPQFFQELNKKEGSQGENLRADIGQEENILAEKVRIYKENYTKSKNALMETSLVKEHMSHTKNNSTNISDHELIIKDDFISKLPDMKEKHKLGNFATGQTTMTNYPWTMSASTKEENSKLGKKNSLSEKTPQYRERFYMTSTCENEIFKGNFCTFPASMGRVGEGEVDKDIFEEPMSVWAVRKMNFQHILEKRNSSFSKSEKIPFRSAKSFSPNEIHQSKKRETKLYPGKALTAGLIGTSRKSEKVIGPRVLMSIIGPSLKEDSEEGGVNLSLILDEIKEDKPKEPNIDKNENKRTYYRLFSSNQRFPRNKGLDDRSFYSISLLEPNDHTETYGKQIKSVEECILVGHRLMWNFELQDAHKCFKLYRAKSLLVELMVIESNLLQIALSGEERKIKRTLEALQAVMNKANNLSFPQKDAPEEYFCNELHKAEICIYKGAMQFFLGSKFQLVRALAEGWRYYRKLEQLVNKKPFKDNLSITSLHRLKFGYGCFNLVFSLIPPGLLKFMKLIGVVEADKEKGLEALEACRTEDNIRSNYSAIVLTLYRIEFEVALEKAAFIMRNSLENYTKCPLFHWLASIICWKYAQAKDAYLLIKTALWQLKANSKDAIYLIYELGWYHFLNMNWEKSLPIFQKIICNALPQQFFKNQVTEASSLAKSLKLSFSINFLNFTENLNSVKEERNCILPHLPHIAVKIAACHFHLGHFELAIKWLLSAYVINKNYSNFKSKQEEDFSKLAVKFLNRCSMKMLAFEVIYLMKYMPKMSDESIMAILEQVEEYQISLTLDKHQLEVYLTSNSKEDPFIVEYFSATLIKIVSYCLMGDTDIACGIYEQVSKFLCLLPDEASYIVYHIEYWVGRALISEERKEEARSILKALLKRKKCEFSINTRIRNVLAEIN